MSSYTEQSRVEINGFEVVDATNTGNRPHDDLIWIGYGGMNGAWLPTDKALQLAEAIKAAATANSERRRKLKAEPAIFHLYNPRGIYAGSRKNTAEAQKYHDAMTEAVLMDAPMDLPAGSHNVTHLPADKWGGEVHSINGYLHAR